MTETVKEHEIYLNFVENLGVLNQSNRFTPLDSMELELLNYIALESRRNNPLLVNEAIALGHIGSRATLHARIKNLREKGYIDFHQDIDGRKKIIKPSGLAIDYFGSVAAILSKVTAARSTLA